jgi:hypothetical protein
VNAWEAKYVPKITTHNHQTQAYIESVLMEGRETNVDLVAKTRQAISEQWVRELAQKLGR